MSGVTGICLTKQKTNLKKRGGGTWLLPMKTEEEALCVFALCVAVCVGLFLDVCFSTMLETNVHGGCQVSIAAISPGADKYL